MLRNKIEHSWKYFNLPGFTLVFDLYRQISSQNNFNVRFCSSKYLFLFNNKAMFIFTPIKFCFIRFISSNFPLNIDHVQLAPLYFERIFISLRKTCNPFLTIFLNYYTSHNQLYKKYVLQLIPMKTLAQLIPPPDLDSIWKQLLNHYSTLISVTDFIFLQKWWSHPPNPFLKGLFFYISKQCPQNYNHLVQNASNQNLHFLWFWS